MGNNNCSARLIFINVCPYGSFGRRLGFPPTANPVGIIVFFLCCCYGYCSGVGLVFLCAQAGTRRQRNSKGAILLQLSCQTYGIVCQQRGSTHSFWTVLIASLPVQSSYPCFFLFPRCVCHAFHLQHIY